MKTIIIVEDDLALNKLLEKTVNFPNIVIKSFINAEDAIEFMGNNVVDIVITDWQLPNLDGMEVATYAKNKYDSFVFMISAKTLTDNLLYALDNGVDDFIRKPFDIREVRLKVKNILNFQNVPKIYETNVFKLDMINHILTIDENDIELSKTEYKIMKLLIESKGEIVSKSDILKNLWGDLTYATETRTVDVHISKLRKKHPELSRIIKTKRGEGVYVDDN